jgi:hypothetical protein
VINEGNKMEVVKFTTEPAITVEDDCRISEANNARQRAANDSPVLLIRDNGGSWAAPMRISGEVLQSDGQTTMSSSGKLCLMNRS